MLLSFGSIAQQSIDLGTLWQRYAFYAGGISGLRSMSDSEHYTAQGEGTIEKYNYLSGEKVALLLDVNALISEEDAVPALIPMTSAQMSNGHCLKQRPTKSTAAVQKAWYGW